MYNYSLNYILELEDQKKRVERIILLSSLVRKPGLLKQDIFTCETRKFGRKKTQKKSWHGK